MLQSIRDHVQGWIAGIIIAILSVTFALWGIQNYIGSHSGQNRAVVKLNDGKITVRQFSNYYRQITSGRPQLAALSGPAKQMLQRQVLAQMIQKQALLDALRDEGFSISTDQVRQVILSEPMFQENGMFSKKRFDQLLYANSMDESQFVERMQAQLLIGQLQTGLQQTAIVLPNEVADSYELMNQTRDIGYFIVPAHLFDKQVKPTQQQLKAYYDKNQSQFMQPEQVSVNYLVLSPQKMAEAIPVSDKQIANFYNSNQSHYRTPRKWMVADINEKSLSAGSAIPGTEPSLDAVSKALKAGKPFTAYKSDKHWVSSVDKQQAALATALAKMNVGQVSDVIDVNGMDHIVKLIAVQDPEQQPLSAVKDQVKKTLQMQQAQTDFSDAADKLANLTYTSPNSLQPAAKALGLKVQSSALFSRDEATGLMANPSVIATVFNPDTISSGNNTSPINLADGTMIVLRIAKHVGAHAKPFADVVDDVTQAVTTDLATKKAMKLANQLKAGLIAGKQPVDLAKQNKVIWYQKNKVLHTNTSIPQNVIGAAFATRFNAKSVANNIVITPLKNNDIALVELFGVHVPTNADIKADQQQVLTKNLQSYAGQLDFDLYNQTAVSDAKVKIQNDVLASL